MISSSATPTIIVITRAMTTELTTNLSPSRRESGGIYFVLENPNDERDGEKRNGHDSEHYAAHQPCGYDGINKHIHVGYLSAARLAASIRL